MYQCGEEDIIQLLGERRAKAVFMRRAGSKFSEIGSVLSVTVERARQIVISSERKIAKAKTGDFVISIRVSNTLHWKGLRTKEEVKAAIISGNLNPYAKYGEFGYTPNYGVKSHQEVCEWVGVEPAEPKPKASPVTLARYISFIERYGYKVIAPEGALNETR